MCISHTANTATGTGTTTYRGSLGLLLYININYSCILLISMTTDIDKDVRRVKELLKPLNRDELKELFEELGLSDATLRNKYSDNTMAYLDDLVRGWILRRDAVLDRGGATWESLKKVLQRLGHNGIAANIPVSTAGKLQIISNCTYIPF